MPQRLQSETAVAQVLAFLVAGVVFIAATGSLLATTATLGVDTRGPDAAAMRREACSLADVLVGSTGSGWERGADNVQRLGLRSAGGGLDADHIQALRGGGTAATANGIVDYEEAARSLGLDPGRDRFHVRLYPVAMAIVMAEPDLRGTHTAYIGDWHALPAVTTPFNASQQVMVDDADLRLATGATAMADAERDALAGLGLGFDDQVHIQVGQPTVQVDIGGTLTPITDVVSQDLLDGDVYPDDKQYLDAVLTARLARYDIVFIGTGTDHNALTSSPVKDGVRDWVLAGGTLVVMGSDSQNVQWLRPLFDVGVTRSGGGSYAPDTNHPLLREPDQLEWGQYDSHGLAWDIDEKDQEKFHPIVLDGSDPVLAVSRPGAFGDGLLLLTTYRPGEISGLQGGREAGSLLHNMVVYLQRNDLYLDYGAAGFQAATGTCMRQSYIQDPLLGQVPVRVEVRAWNS